MDEPLLPKAAASFGHVGLKETRRPHSSTQAEQFEKGHVRRHAPCIVDREPTTR